MGRPGSKTLVKINSKFFPKKSISSKNVSDFTVFSKLESKTHSPKKSGLRDLIENLDMTDLTEYPLKGEKSLPRK